MSKLTMLLKNKNLRSSNPKPITDAEIRKHSISTSYRSSEVVNNEILVVDVLDVNDGFHKGFILTADILIGMKHFANLIEIEECENNTCLLTSNEKVFKVFEDISFDTEMILVEGDKVLVSVKTDLIEHYRMLNGKFA